MSKALSAFTRSKPMGVGSPITIGYRLKSEYLINWVTTFGRTIMPAIASSSTDKTIPLIPLYSAMRAMPVNWKSNSGGLMKNMVTPPVPGCSSMKGRSKSTIWPSIRRFLMPTVQPFTSQSTTMSERYSRFTCKQEVPCGKSYTSTSRIIPGRSPMVNLESFRPFSLAGSLCCNKGSILCFTKWDASWSSCGQVWLMKKFNHSSCESDPVLLSCCVHRDLCLRVGGGVGLSAASV
mmetsp:Transcript_51626/g.160178  ORF Transcript_51626/g.160178 Transcript_51626/m.160178 type:complete len:235 (+) Transcript_51626:1082-1786(+)